MISRFQINGFRGLFFFYNSLYRFSTTTTFVQPIQSHFLVDYLINSLGLSKDEAFSATKKVRPFKSSRNDPDLVVNFFKELGMNKTQIRSIISAEPRLLTCNVDKTLKPKVLVLQELGISESDLIKVLMSFKSVLARGVIRRSIEYLRNLLDSDENVAVVIKKFSPVLDICAHKSIESNVQLLNKQGFSREFVSRFLLENPRCFMQNPDCLEKALYMVDNEIGIPRNSRMFYHGVVVLCSLSKTTIHMKVTVLRSFGLSDSTIYSMIKQYPSILGASEDKLRKVWNFFTNEIGYPPDFLPARPVIFNLSLEKRVIPRYEVLKALNEKNLSRRKVGLYRILCISNSTFIKEFLLPYKDEIPNVVDSYFKIVGRKKTGEL